MPLYSFRCRSCDRSDLIQAPIRNAPGPYPCVVCGTGWMKRDYREDRPLPGPVWQEHWNPTVGDYVSDRKKMQSMMDRASDRLYETHGIEQRNVVVDRADLPSLKGQSD